MEILRDGERLEPARPTVVTVGIFDGVHRGHAHLHGRVLAEARRLKAAPGVVTFDRHPFETVLPARAPCLLTNLDQRLAFLREEGMEVAYVIGFTAEAAAVEAEDFVRDILVEALGVRKIIVGQDFHFGHDRAGDPEMLRKLGEHLGFEVEAMPLVENDGGKISSTAIRRLVAEGRIREAAKLLGRRYRLAGRIVRGAGLGRKIGFPTANLEPSPRMCMPGTGVYAGWWRWRGQRLPGVINVGVRPTVHTDAALVVEIHVFDLDEDLYGEPGEIEFDVRLREERRFDSVEELTAQIRRDAEEARRVLRG